MKVLGYYSDLFKNHEYNTSHSDSADHDKSHIHSKS